MKVQVRCPATAQYCVPVGAIGFEIVGVRLELLPRGIALALHRLAMGGVDAAELEQPRLEIAHRGLCGIEVAGLAGAEVLSPLASAIVEGRRLASIRAISAAHSSGGRKPRNWNSSSLANGARCTPGRDSRISAEDFAGFGHGGAITAQMAARNNRCANTPGGRTFSLCKRAPLCNRRWPSRDAALTGRARRV